MATKHTLSEKTSGEFLLEIFRDSAGNPGEKSKCVFEVVSCGLRFVVGSK